MPKIFVLGSFIAALTIRVPRVPVLGESLVGDQFDLGPGGKGSNQAIAAARQGAEVNMLACLGDDIFADMATELYRQENMALDHIHRLDNINTGIAFITLMPSGENFIVLDLGANDHLTPDHVDAVEPLIAEGDIVMAQFEIPTESVARGMELGRKHGKMTILNPAPARSIDPDVLANVDILTPNDTETRILQGLSPDDPTSTPELAQRLLGFGVEQVIATMGEAGSMIITSAGSQHVPTVEIEAVDVTGAGDSFNAALAVGLGQGLKLEDAVRKANISGAYTCTHLGVIPGLPTRAELDAFHKS